MASMAYDLDRNRCGVLAVGCCAVFTGFVRSHLDEPHRDCFGTKFSSKIMT